jgi:aerobic C4-dicarboxylate transport protein
MQAELASGGRAIDNTAPIDDLGVAETAPTPVVRS